MYFVVRKIKPGSIWPLGKYGWKHSIFLLRLWLLLIAICTHRFYWYENPYDTATGISRTNTQPEDWFGQNDLAKENAIFCTLQSPFSMPYLSRCAGMMVHTFNPATKEAEAGGCLWLWDIVSYRVEFCLKIVFKRFSFISFLISGAMKVRAIQV